MNMGAIARLLRPFMMATLFGLAAARTSALAAEVADTILVHGKILTVDRDFSLAAALAIKGPRWTRTIVFDANAESGARQRERST
jgi:hypothetical protein